MTAECLLKLFDKACASLDSLSHPCTSLDDQFSCTRDILKNILINLEVERLLKQFDRAYFSLDKKNFLGTSLDDQFSCTRDILKTILEKQPKIQTSCSKKDRATEICSTRETAIVHYINGHKDLEEIASLFPCPPSKLSDLKYQIVSIDGFIKCQKAGGLGKNYDMEIVTQDGVKQVEIKCSNMPQSDVSKQPWKGGVQILQGQIMAALTKGFLDSEKFYKTWFKDYLLPFLKDKIKDFSKLDYADYRDISCSIDKHTKKKTLACDLINLLRQDSKICTELQKEWFRFEAAQLNFFKPDKQKLLTELNLKIKQKEMWININALTAELITGFEISSIEDLDVLDKPKGGAMYRFKMVINVLGGAQDGGAPAYKVTTDMRFNWKNGGQPVQNLNFMIVPH